MQMNEYRTIYADPPWNETGGGVIRRGADAHYPLMKTQDICNMAPFIHSLRDSHGCHLYLWATNNHLQDALRVMAAWDFRYVTMITWFKEGNIGLGQYFRGCTEHCLFGVWGMLPYRMDVNNKRMQGVTGFSAPRGVHSEKPKEMRTMIERVSYGPRIELFARQTVPGWDAWGNEVTSMLQQKKEG
jgi:N6-adenosine-specific RNA methylase IME4